MKKPDYAQWKTHKKVKGFSLTELVIVIIIIAILALAVFAGGSASIKKAQLSRATSDLNNFNIAIETYMFSNRDPVKLKNSSTKSEFDSITDGLNKVLPQDYNLEKSKTIPQTGNIYSTLTDQIVYQSAKEDPWGNPYYFLMDMQARNAGNTEYFFTVLSAGPNAKANVGGEVDKDDIFLLSQYMSSMFNSCYKLTSLDVSSFDTSNVTNMYSMFIYCSKLTSLDVSSFNTSKVTNMDSMFQNCFKLVTIYASDLWSTASVTESSSSMFYNCASLVGGSGVAFNSASLDKTMANTTSGYLTYKPAST